MEMESLAQYSDTTARIFRRAGINGHISRKILWANRCQTVPQVDHVSKTVSEYDIATIDAYNA